MWNVFETFQTGGMVAGTTTMMSGGKEIHTYIARPDGDGPYPGIVLLHHAPGGTSSSARSPAASPFTGISPYSPICMKRLAPVRLRKPLPRSGPTVASPTIAL